MIRSWTLSSFAGMVLLLGCGRPVDSTDSHNVEDAPSSLLAVFKADPPRSLSPEEYVEWNRDPENRLSATKDLFGIRYELKYTPVELLALRQLVNQDNLSQENFNAERKALENFQFFTLSIGTTSGINILKAGTRTDKERENRVNYFSSKMQQDIALVEGIDTMRCTMYQFENLNGLANHANFLLAFPLRSSRKNTFPDKTFLLHQAELGSGLVSLEIKGDAIKNIPNLDIKTEE